MDAVAPTPQQCITAHEAITQIGIGLIKRAPGMEMPAGDILRLLGIAVLQPTTEARGQAMDQLIAYIDQKVTYARLVEDPVTKEVRAEPVSRISLEDALPKA